MALTISTYVMLKYVKNLLFDNEGRATIKPIIIARIIDTTEIYIVVVIPLIKNFRLVSPSIFSGLKIYQPHS